MISIVRTIKDIQNVVNKIMLIKKTFDILKYNLKNILEFEISKPEKRGRGYIEG